MQKFTIAAQRVASGSLGYGYRGLGALLGLLLARELAGAMVGLAMIIAFLAIPVSLGIGIDMLAQGSPLALIASCTYIAALVLFVKPARGPVLTYLAVITALILIVLITSSLSPNTHSRLDPSRSFEIAPETATMK